ncbi:MAG: Ppx/GppA family phosphatase, partial [Pseudomonadota bacterium]
MTNPPRAAGDPAKSAAKTGSYRQQRARRGPPPRYAALDLGTNNCRLLIAAPRGRHLRIVDAYSKIVRLG